MVDRRQSIQSRIYQYRRERKKFSIKVYIIALIFVAISFVQWFLFGFPFITFRDGMKNYYYIAFPFLIIALLCIMVFVMSGRLRFLFPINWILSLVIVECVTLGMIWGHMESSWLTIIICALVSLGVVIIFLIIGIMIPGDLTLHVMILFVFSIVLFLGSIFFVMWSLLVDIYIPIFIYMGIIAIMVLMFIVYHGQTIHGGRFAEMRTNDYLLAALLLHLDFVVFYLPALFVYTAYIQKHVFMVDAREGPQHDCTFCEKNITAVIIK